MIDLRAARNDPEPVRAALARRGAGEAFDELLAADERWRVFVPQVDELRSRQKLDGKPTPEQLEQLRRTKDELKAAEDQLAAAEAARDAALAKVPNVPHETAADGFRDEDAIVVREWGERRTGEALPEHLMRRFTARFGGQVYDGIGSAEMFHIYCSNRPGDVKPGSLGRVVTGYELKILAEDAEGPGAPEMAPGDIGVLWVKGDSVAHGYFGDRDKSWKTFHGHWCRTGDLFSIDAQGYLYFQGRADDLFKVGGIFVAPREVEDCLLGHPAVSMVAVIPAEDQGLVKPKAVIVLRPEARTQDRASLASELKVHVQSRLSKHKYPRWIVFVDDLPKNDRGKVDKKLLKSRETS